MEEYFAIYLAYANGVTQKSSQYVVLIYIYFTVWLPGQRVCNWLGSNYTKVLYNNIQLQTDRRTELKVALHSKPVATSVSGCGTFTIH